MQAAQTRVAIKRLAIKQVAIEQETQRGGNRQTGR